MNIFSKILVITILSGIFFAGCYTQLMTPQEFVQIQRQSSKRIIIDNSYSVNYNQSCVTCHSQSELNERAEELEMMGVRTVHNGVLLSSRPGENISTENPPIYISDPNPYWTHPYLPVNPWWSPPVSTGTTTSSTPSNGNRTRDDGTTRDGNRERDRSTPTTYTTPQSPVGGSTPSVPVSPPPASTVSTPPPAAPAQSNDSERSRESSGGNNSSRTRSDGNSRDDSGNRPR